MDRIPEASVQYLVDKARNGEFTSLDSEIRAMGRSVYSDGADEGWQYGYEEGYSVGRDEGVDEGYTLGYDAGYAAGVADSQPELEEVPGEYQD